MKKLLTVSVALAALAAPSLAFAEQVRVYDPSEGEFVIIERNANSANAEAARAAKDGYDRVVRVYDPAEGEFAEVRIGSGLPSSAIATNDAADRPTKLYYDPSEGEFVRVPAN